MEAVQAVSVWYLEETVRQRSLPFQTDCIDAAYHFRWIPPLSFSLSFFVSMHLRTSQLCDLFSWRGCGSYSVWVKQRLARQRASVICVYGLSSSLTFFFLVVVAFFFPPPKRSTPTHPHTQIHTRKHSDTLAHVRTLFFSPVLVSHIKRNAFVSEVKKRRHPAKPTHAAYTLLPHPSVALPRNPPFPPSFHSLYPKRERERSIWD